MSFGDLNEEDKNGTAPKPISPKKGLQVNPFLNIDNTNSNQISQTPSNNSN